MPAALKMGAKTNGLSGAYWLRPRTGLKLTEMPLSESRELLADRKLTVQSTENIKCLETSVFMSRPAQPAAIFAL